MADSQWSSRKQRIQQKKKRRSDDNGEGDSKKMA